MGHYFTNEDLKSNIVEYSFNFNNNNFTFKTDNGVFSKGELDYGTYLLLKNVLSKKIDGRVLDLGCGYGAIGIVISKIMGTDTYMVDVNRRALHLTTMNAKCNKVNVTVMESDGYEALTGLKFNYIISNPPIRVGKEKLYSLLINARDYLKENGEMIIVVRKQQGAESLIRDLSVYYDVKVVDKSKGFFIISFK